MKRYLLAVIVAGGAFASTASAQFGGMPPQMMQQNPYAQQGGAIPGMPGEAVEEKAPVGHRFGLAPNLRKLIFWRDNAGSCRSCDEQPRHGHGGHHGHSGAPVNPGAGVPGYPGSGVQTPGTLVFPQHPFIRSPRDFFMQDVGK